MDEPCISRFLAFDYGYAYGVKWKVDDYYLVILKLARYCLLILHLLEKL